MSYILESYLGYEKVGRFVLMHALNAIFHYFKSPRFLIPFVGKLGLLFRYSKLVL